MMDEILPGLIQNLGFFGPAAFLGWWIIKNQRADIVAERDRYMAELAQVRERNQQLTDRVFTLAESSARTLQELTAAVRALDH